MLAFVLIIGLASARLARLALDDSIFDEPRDEILDHTEGKLATLLSCPWCVSAYTTGALIAVVDLAGFSVPLPFVVWLAAWQVAVAAYFTTDWIAGRD